LILSDFNLAVKDGLTGNDAITAAVKQWVTSGVDFYECSIQASLHHWQKYISKVGDHTEN